MEDGGERKEVSKGVRGREGKEWETVREKEGEEGVMEGTKLPEMREEDEGERKKVRKGGREE